MQQRRAYSRQPQLPTFRNFRRPSENGYPRQKPRIPFRSEEFSQEVVNIEPWHHSREYNIPVLPPSPYKVDSPDPESLWPEGLFLPPLKPTRFGSRRSGNTNMESDPFDPYLLEGSEAIAAVEKASHHGELYFHDIPHINSLLANQDLRVKNNLKPHRIASIRRSWPYNRP